MPSTGLQKKVFHDCALPDISPDADYRFTCPECGSTWSTWRNPLSEREEHYGFLGLRTRTVVVPSRAQWFADNRTHEWREV